MRCRRRNCTCGTVDGGFCSDVCALLSLEGAAQDGCDCGHAGCDYAARRV